MMFLPARRMLQYTPGNATDKNVCQVSLDLACLVSLQLQLQSLASLLACTGCCGRCDARGQGSSGCLKRRTCAMTSLPG